MKRGVHMTDKQLAGNTAQLSVNGVHMTDKQLAKKIAEGLFLYGATRLELKRGPDLAHEKVLGGWCKDAVVACVTRILRDSKEK